MPVPMSSDAAVRRRLRKDDVLERLLEAILDGTLQPGERLRDGELQEWFGVSRTPIRLAMDRLEELRLVESRVNRFTRVSPVAPERIPQLTDVMCSLWALAVRLTVARLSDAEAAECLRRLDRACHACRSHPATETIDTVEVIRQALLHFSELSGSRLLVELVTKLGVSLRFQAAMVGARLDMPLLDDTFRRLSAAVRARDPEAAAAVFGSLRSGSVLLEPSRATA